ncbi:MAG TPA: hypothetical protein VFJ09_04880 [Nocardioidaceae bacterium]|nr:hypothetical protein [Nocardioidaceae bacterium]
MAEPPRLPGEMLLRCTDEPQGRIRTPFWTFFPTQQAALDLGDALAGLAAGLRGMCVQGQA